jgi:hypothetical protein
MADTQTAGQTAQAATAQENGQELTPAQIQDLQKRLAEIKVIFQKEVESLWEGAVVWEKEYSNKMTPLFREVRKIKKQLEPVDPKAAEEKKNKKNMELVISLNDDQLATAIAERNRLKAEAAKIAPAAPAQAAPKK